MSEIHIGEHIKSIVERHDMSVSDFAKRINKSRVNVYSIFNRNSIDTQLLQVISEVLDYDFFALFSKSNNAVIKRLNELEEEISHLKKFNQLLIEKTEGK